MLDSNNDLTPELYNQNAELLKRRDKIIKKIFVHHEDKAQFLRHLNLNFNPDNYKYKELVNTDIKDKTYLLEQYYKKNNIPYSPLLLYPPEENKEDFMVKKEDFEYYKRHIILENYDEEPEEIGSITQKIKELKEKNGKVHGKTKWFDSVGKQDWKECEILSYDEELKLFKIRVESGRDYIEKKVTRFNCLIGDEDDTYINKRIRLANNWKVFAQKYVALDNFITECKVENPYNFATEEYMNKLLCLAFLYTGKNKPQCTPLEFELMDNNNRFGIWRKFSFPRIIEVNANKLNAILKNIPQKEITNFINELQELNERSYHMETFYRSLSDKYQYYELMKMILPKRKFLNPSETLVLPEKHSALLIFPKKHNFIETFTKMQYKLHQNEKDFSKLLINIKTLEEKSLDHLYFNKTFLNKPILIPDFFLKNESTEKDMLKEISYMISHTNFDIIQAYEERKKEAAKVDKNAGVPEHIIHKFRKFEALMNREIASFSRGQFHRGIIYLTNVFKLINDKIQKEHGLEFSEFAKEFYNYDKYYKKVYKEKENEAKEKVEQEYLLELERMKNEKKKKGKKTEKIKMQEVTVEFSEDEKEVLAKLEEKIPKFELEKILEIRDNYPLEYEFNVDFHLMQFQMELKSTNKSFYLEPDFDQFWEGIEKHIRNTFKDLCGMQKIHNYDILSKEEQDKYLGFESHLKVFSDDDKSYECEIDALNFEIKKYYSSAEILLRHLNNVVMPDLFELMKFASGKNLDEESVNITIFRHFIDENNKYIDFFNNVLKYDKFFLGGIILDCRVLKETWLKKLEETREKLFKLVMNNNVFLSDKIEKERKEIEKILDEEPKTVEEYSADLAYCAKFSDKITGIWDKIKAQQENAILLEDNLKEVKGEDFFRMWRCYGVPKLLQLRKEETDERLRKDRKRFKKLIKQRNADTISQISSLKQDFETNTFVSDIDKFEDTFNFFSKKKYDIEQLEKTCKTLNEHETVLKMKNTDLSEIKVIKQKFAPYFTLWQAVNELLTGFKSWMTDHLKMIKRLDLKQTYENYTEALNNLEATTFKKELKAPYNVIQLTKAKINEFEPIYPVIYDLLNPDFKTYHIGDLGRTIGIDIPEKLDINMEDLIKMGILEHKKIIHERSEQITKERKKKKN